MRISKIIKQPKHIFQIITFILLLLILLFMIVCIYDYTIGNGSVAKKLHLNIWDWFTLLVAAFSLCFTILTWWSQDQTRENTTKLSPKDYRNMLISCYYNIVRNTINLYSLAECLKDKYSYYYPSEEYLQKLKLYLFDASQTSSQNIPLYYYGNFQRISELCRYFNIHIDVTQKHLSSREITINIKKRDMEYLKSMHWLIASEIMKTINYICPDDKESNFNLVCREFINVVENFNPHTVLPKNSDHTLYIQKDSVEFLMDLFKPNQNDYDQIIKALNSTIEWHLGQRPDGYSRIPLIPISSLYENNSKD